MGSEARDWDYQERCSALLSELTELSRKHRIRIHGCCCDPILVDLEDASVVGHYTFDEDDGLRWRDGK